MEQLKIVIKNLQKRIPLNRKKIHEVIRKVFSCEAIEKKSEITVCFVNDQRITALNHRYLGKKSPTDVLAFDLRSGPDALLIADIVVSTDTAAVQSRVFHTSVLFEVYLYIVHGLLHIIGYDDSTPKEKRRMNMRARQILSELKIHSL